MAWPESDIPATQSSTEHRKGYCFASLTGARFSTDQFIEHLESINKEMRRSRTGRLMLELNIGQFPSEEEIMTIVTAQMKIMPGIRLALVNHNADQLEATEFWAAVAQDAAEEYGSASDVEPGEKFLFYGGKPS
jgi:hypothetical protein